VCRMSRRRVYPRAVGQQSGVCLNYAVLTSIQHTSSGSLQFAPSSPRTRAWPAVSSSLRRLNPWAVYCWYVHAHSRASSSLTSLRRGGLLRWTLS
jgi:hypothetical protein